MNENWYWQLAQERQRELREEAKNAQLLREAGIRDNVPGAVKVLGLVLLILPFVFVVVRVLSI